METLLAFARWLSLRACCSRHPGQLDRLDKQNAGISGAAGADSDVVSPATFAPLTNRTFRSIWLATQVSSLGWLMQTVAISWLMATISPSDLMVALVQASSTLPAFILSVFAGVLADNCRRRRVMFAG